VKPDTFLILIVDDEETMRLSMAELLRLEGFLTETAKDGVEAINQINERTEINPENPYDLVLLDLKMPGADGLEVLRHLSSVSPGTQIILLTAHGSLQSAIEALQHGAHDYILKPATPEKIIQSVRDGLAKRADLLRRVGLVKQLEKTIQGLQVYPEGNRTGWGAETPIYNQDGTNSKNKIKSAESQIKIAQNVTLNSFRREIYSEYNSISLTPSETRLLVTLVNAPERVFTHKELVRRVQGYETSKQDAPKVIRPLVSRLRRKLETFPDGKAWIISIRSVGYSFKSNS
jgi:DNA-binding response OmpR family regulator